MVRAGVSVSALASARLSWHHKIVMSINGAIKKRGRPATGPGTSINLRLQASQLAALDNWIAAQPEPVSRPEGIRIILTNVLNHGGE